MKKLIAIIFTIVLVLNLSAQNNSANVYWVGHSLISHTYAHDPASENLMNLMNTLVSSQSKDYEYYDHTIPGAPLGWNWGHGPASWTSGTESIIQPLINSSHADYGSFDVMVLTEGIDVSNTYSYWASSFYARKFFNAAKNANSNTRLFLYESWHHYNASDPTFRPEYGPMASFNWDNYMGDSRQTWNDILMNASDPNLTQTDAGYSFQGSGSDPGNGSDMLDINIIPTGTVLREVLQRLEANLASDDWSFGSGVLSDTDFFENPLANYPTDTVTKIHPSDPLDDIHPSNVLIYLNALVHYSVIYQDNPNNLPAANGVPDNIATIFKEIVWNVVTNDPMTGVLDTNPTAVSNIDFVNKISVYPNPCSHSLNIELEMDRTYDLLLEVCDVLGVVVYSEKIDQKQMINKVIATDQLKSGIYFISIQNKNNNYKSTYNFIKN